MCISPKEIFVSCQALWLYMLKRELNNPLYCYLIALLINGDSRGGGGGQRQASKVMPNIGW